MPRQQSTAQSLQTCMYVPAGQSRAGRREEEKEQRRVKGEYVESGRQDGGVCLSVCVPLCTHTEKKRETHDRVDVCTDKHETCARKPSH